MDTNFVPAATFAETPLPADFGATEIPFRLWNLVQGWARDHGYAFNYDGDLGSMGNAPSSVAHTNTEPVTEDRLGARLMEVFKTRAERVVFVKGDPDLEFMTVAKAIDAAKGAGIDKVGLMTPKIEAGQ